MPNFVHICLFWIGTRYWWFSMKTHKWPKMSYLNVYISYLNMYPCVKMHYKSWFKIGALTTYPMQDTTCMILFNSSLYMLTWSGHEFTELFENNEYICIYWRLVAWSLTLNFSSPWKGCFECISLNVGCGIYTDEFEFRMGFVHRSLKHRRWTITRGNRAWLTFKILRL